MGAIPFQIGAQTAQGKRRPATGGEPDRIDPREIRMGGEIRAGGEPVERDPEVLCPRPVLQSFLEVEVPPRAVRMIHGKYERTRLGQARREPAECADMAAEAVARQDHGETPLRHPGVFENRGSAKHGVLTEGDGPPAALGGIPEPAGHLPPVMLRGDDQAAKPRRFRGGSLGGQQQDCGRGQVLHRSSPMPIRIGHKIGARTTGRVLEPVRGRAESGFDPQCTP